MQIRAQHRKIRMSSEVDDQLGTEKRQKFEKGIDKRGINLFHSPQQGVPDMFSVPDILRYINMDDLEGESYCCYYNQDAFFQGKDFYLMIGSFDRNFQKL